MSVHDYYARYWLRADPELATEATTLRMRQTLILDALRRYGMLGSPSRVLDAGCGAGEFLRFFAEREFEVYGIDLVQEALERAQQLCPGASLHLGSLEEPLPFSSGFFDVVWCTEVLEHLFLPASALKEFHRVLKAGGLLIVTTPYHGFLKNLAVLSFGFERHFDVTGAHIRFFTKRSLVCSLTASGFKVMAARGLGRVWPVYKSVLVVARKPWEPTAGDGEPERHCDLTSRAVAGSR